MQYLLQDLLRMPLEERLKAIEMALSTNKTQGELSEPNADKIPKFKTIIMSMELKEVNY